MTQASDPTEELLLTVNRDLQTKAIESCISLVKTCNSVHEAIAELERFKYINQTQ